jgi:hypothetical protein
MNAHISKRSIMSLEMLALGRGKLTCNKRPSNYTKRF